VEPIDVPLPDGRDPKDPGIDWERTKAYSLGILSPITVNLIGREPQGIIQPGKKQELLINELIERLKTLKAPDTGEQLFDFVLTNDEVCSGPCLEAIPDLMVILGMAFGLTGLAHLLSDILSVSFQENFPFLERCFPLMHPLENA